MIDIMRRLLVGGIAIGVIVANSDEVTRFFDETVAMTQLIATAGDMRSIGNMLDYEYMKKGRFPTSEAFESWMARTFAENNLKPLDEDHWGTPYLYETTGRHAYRLRSAGPDKIMGSFDDLIRTGP